LLKNGCEHLAKDPAEKRKPYNLISIISKKRMCETNKPEDRTTTGIWSSFRNTDYAGGSRTDEKT